MMSEDNPYTLAREIYELCGELEEDLSFEYHDLDMSLCKEVIKAIEIKHQKLKEWIKYKEELNKKAEG